LFISKGPFILQAAAIADRLEGVLERLEAALAAREAEIRRLKRIESAAGEALAELDVLLTRAEPDAGSSANDLDTPRALRSAEFG
jgi:hypothetical protein